MGCTEKGSYVGCTVVVGVVVLNVVVVDVAGTVVVEAGWKVGNVKMGAVVGCVVGCTVVVVVLVLVVVGCTVVGW